jgi:rod shape-determining protein MreC
MDFYSRHRNTVVLTTLLLVQLVALAVQVKRQTAEGPVRLIHLVAVGTLAPFERLAIHSGQGMRTLWVDYLDLRNVRKENDRLKAEAAQLRLERARDLEDARQARRIQALLGFKEQWIDQTVAAQVIGTSGTETSRLLYIDKGSSNGIKADMPVITPDGVVGKVLNVYGDTAQVLLISDPSSGVGAILVNSRLQGIVKGSATGEVGLNYIMGDEPVQVGDALVTSGGDRVFPKGLPLGSVQKVALGRNLFLDIKIKTAVDLSRLEEVLVITQQKAREASTTAELPVRASDILSEHLPQVPQQAAPQTQPGQAAAQGATQPAPAHQPTAPAVPLAAKPSNAVNTPAAAKPKAVSAAGGQPEGAPKQ